ncbi:hypothetical protein [Terrihalobacillus insolitus]|uniref:hypothetical protein n=1 Tax=Terrihalobacillus insolitus TaxID=2950438 RepID=UPI0023427B3A|nr:hypothetical protein [Terrihalobacillus insolitus]MDC3414282.1 hypothetical protein [Terrihalobacillus insolitus]
MNIQEIHEAIKDYSWMIKVLISKRKEMVESSNGLVAKGGIESTLPKPQNISDPVYQEILRIEKYEKNTNRVRKKVMFIQRHSKCIKNTKNKIILDLLLDGLPLREVALELDMSLSGVKRRKDVIVNQIYQSHKAEQKAQKEKISMK